MEDAVDAESGAAGGTFDREVSGVAFQFHPLDSHGVLLAAAVWRGGSVADDGGVHSAGRDPVQVGGDFGRLFAFGRAEGVRRVVGPAAAGVAGAAGRCGDPAGESVVGVRESAAGPTDDLEGPTAGRALAALSAAQVGGVLTGIVHRVTQRTSRRDEPLMWPTADCSESFGWRRGR